MFSQNKKYWIFILIVLLGVSVFLPTFDAGWVYDDFPVVARNPDIKSFEGFFENSYPGRPVRELTYMLDYSLFGDDPTGYHFQNILWHIVAAVLIVLVMRKLGRSETESSIAALLFLVHPLVVEVVAPISHRKESLLLVFSLLSVLCFFKAVRENRFYYVPMVVCMVIAYMTKESVVVLPFALFYIFFSWKTEVNGICKRLMLFVGGGFLSLLPWMYFLAGSKSFDPILSH